VDAVRVREEEHVVTMGWVADPFLRVPAEASSVKIPATIDLAANQVIDRHPRLLSGTCQRSLTRCRPPACTKSLEFGVSVAVYRLAQFLCEPAMQSRNRGFPINRCDLSQGTNRERAEPRVGQPRLEEWHGGRAMASNRVAVPDAVAGRGPRREPEELL
jgi:hypothetical protein